MSEASEATAEQWAVVEGFAAYEVSTAGRVRRIGSDSLLTPQMINGGYWKVQFWKGGRNHNRLIHVLVAAAFIGPCPAGKEVNHKNGREKWNNAVSNLEYMTRSQNMKHAYATGLRKPSVEQMIAKRRQPRVQVGCACGCGEMIVTPDRKGRPRRFVMGHQARSLNHV